MGTVDAGSILGHHPAVIKRPSWPSFQMSLNCSTYAEVKTLLFLPARALCNCNVCLYGRGQKWLLIFVQQSILIALDKVLLKGSFKITVLLIINLNTNFGDDIHMHLDLWKRYLFWWTVFFFEVLRHNTFCFKKRWLIYEKLDHFSNKCQLKT